MIRNTGCASRVKHRHRIGNAVSRECEHRLVDDNDRDLAVSDRLAVVIFDFDIDLGFAARRQSLFLRFGGNSQFARGCRYRKIDVSARKCRTVRKLRVDLALIVLPRGCSDQINLCINIR